MVFGYARVSTEDQDLSLQIAALRKYGIPDNQIFSEHASGKTMQRKSLKLLLKVMREGDTLVVWKLDRLGRSLKGVLQTVDDIEKGGINFVSLTEMVDTGSAMGRFFFHIMAAMAELERGMISERTKAGMAVRKAENPDIKWGAKHAILDHPKRLEHIQGLYNSGEFTVSPREAGGLKWKGMTARELLAEINASDPKARKVKSEATVHRWFHSGATGLVLRAEDKQ
ncbi:recombinase family protein [Roseobacter sp.]|uniref:recombinase family protein n=1 Tax=Roseobacter sp. TaxID=1907202 RepID=UPI00385ED370